MTETKPETCRIEWCLLEPKEKLSYGLEYPPFWRCSRGHVTPQPPPVDIGAIEDCDWFD